MTSSATHSLASSAGLHLAGCDIITLGQYLQSDPKKLRVKEFIHPDQFKAYEDFGLQIGVRFMYCGPFVRSSYNANLFAPGLAQPIEST